MNNPWRVRLGVLPRAFAFSLMLLCATLSSTTLQAADFQVKAAEYRAQLRDKILPYWLAAGVDREHGGYILNDDARRKLGPLTEKQLVTQARMIWGFSHAHRKGYSDASHDYLQAAKQGWQFLREHFYDRENGGYYWTTDVAGQPRDTRKIVYGESFAIYGLVEYYRASGDAQALAQAMELYQALQKHAHDAKNGGWLEHFQSDWTPILKNENIPVEVGGCKSANTHLHLMEALTELYDASRNAEVRQSLEEAVRLNAVYFYPSNAAEANFHRHLDWSPVTAPTSAGLSYGHNVEFAWLLIRAEQVLGLAPSWGHFNAYLQHALKYGYDPARGGLYSRGMGAQPANDTEKIWWVEAEMMAALSDALAHQANSAYSEALSKLIDFINRYQADPKDGVWLESVTADGQPRSTAKAHNWKANYHDVRALQKFCDTFDPAGQAATPGAKR